MVMEPMHGTEAVQAGGQFGTNAFDIRTKIPIAPALRAEVRAAPLAPQSSMRRSRAQLHQLPTVL